MTCERPIGGEMPVSLADFMAEGPSSAWPTYQGRRSIRCDSGRTALALAVNHWCKQGHKPWAVWLPHYLCHSVAAGVRGSGVPLRFYEDGPGGMTGFQPPSPRADDLVVAVHYFGRVNEAMLGFAAAGKRDWGLIEDCVQSTYSDGVGVSGDYAITSLRKWWPAPDGASLHLADDDWAAPLEAPDEGFVSRRLMAKLLREGDAARERRYLELVDDSEAQLDQSDTARVPSWISGVLLESVDLPAMAARRRTNFDVLASRLLALCETGAPLRLLHSGLHAGEVPLALAVLLPAELRNPLRQWLAARRIFCPVHWQLEAHASAAAQSLSVQMLSLPLDQRYGDADMHRVADTVCSFFEGLHRE
jgi:hypothetical protein